MPTPIVWTPDVKVRLVGDACVWLRKQGQDVQENTFYYSCLNL